ncbi:hypothetical protein I2494_06710 [Budviciaceae bacterium BWR-B9]|uniref:Uncharacterized protein n=1 Tax=Limnobaculum allomyrinae TaxID=2791986 RepID=A0ABS1IPB8_9GAMM|nr:MULTISPECIES: hypothetical protein [Limnobaculum]MBK5143412.1 hypothetical protein [Limnobaculum allomyrinae]MBV7691300.1 hypothetical protein [Limnobaculum sp. M2-1]
MRLNFNIVIVDDDFEDFRSNKCRSINRLIEDVSQHIEKKGFTPIFFKYTNVDACLNDESIDGNKHQNRIDFYLSDNNLDGDENKNGIDLYLKLKDSIDKKVLCDFVLYTRSEIDEIIEKLSKKLNTEKDPNLFTRFTFISRPNEASDTDWHDRIKSVLDYIITQREEINHLRGLFAQITARMHNILKEKLNNDNLTFKDAIDTAYNNKFIKLSLRRKLHTQRNRRNGIIHNDEEFDPKLKEFKIKCSDTEDSSRGKPYGHSEFQKLREYLKSTENELLEQVK